MAEIEQERTRQYREDDVGFIDVKKIDGSVANLSNSLRFLDKVNTWTADKMQEIQADVRKGKGTSEELLAKLVEQQQELSKQLHELQRQQGVVSKLVHGLAGKSTKRNNANFTGLESPLSINEQNNGTEVRGACSGFLDGG